ncbi:MAG: hypothetical protein HYV27_14030 [Candidatus Hydrogenedentes bacterium]|nr:hypothetical protein [Candidatus Hydrogenedentota bacterium]
MEWTSTPELLHLSHSSTPVFEAVPPAIAGQAPVIQIDAIEPEINRVSLIWRLDADTAVDDIALNCVLNFIPGFWWAPHLAPEPGHCIAQHVFRSPAVIAVRGDLVCALVPDLGLCGTRQEAPWYLDVDAPRRTITLGMSRTEVVNHVGYRKSPGMQIPAGPLELAFFIVIDTSQEGLLNPWRKLGGFLWERYARPLLAQGQPHTVPMDRYVEHTYRWAFETWKEAVWQEFDLNGVRVGAPCFIVTVTQSPNYPGEPSHREPLSIWNQAWFSSLRSASGAFRYARRTGNTALLERARLTKAFALAAPMKKGLFPAVYRTEMETVEKDGERIMKSKGWETGYWTNSDRCPRNFGVTPDWYHVLDMSWTALLMLRWHEDLEPDPALLDYATAYGKRLLTLQDQDGFFPGWLHPEAQSPGPVMNQTPESSMSATLLFKLAEHTGETIYRDAALRTVEAVLREIVPAGRWEDYETYWSCCPYGQMELLGKRVERNGIYKQNNLSIFWTAEALLAAYRATRLDRYLHYGRRCLDELAMCQQVWQPPYIYIPALGGFGVMNYDAEWNDSRQSLFAELFLEYYRETGHTPYFERGASALKAAFVMMYCPENPNVKGLWERVWTFFGPEDYGFTMENYGHDGVTSAEGIGIGPFTIFDWGNGAAAEARNRIHDHYGDVYLDRVRGQGFGVDAVQVTRERNRFAITDRAARPRTIRIVFEDGTTREMELKERIELPAGVPG